MPVTAFAQADDVVVSCPDAQTFMQMLEQGTLNTLPNIRLQDGIRVQMQHPDTELDAHSKYIEANGRTGFACQYYNYVGMVGTAFFLDYQKLDTPDGVFWRTDWKDSFVEINVIPNLETITVCMEQVNDVAVPSPRCPFRKTGNTRD